MVVSVRGGRSGSAAITVEDFSRIVSRIYAAAVTPEYWDPVIRDVVGTLDGKSAALVGADGSSRWHVGAILAPEAAKSYAEYYSRIDNVLAAVEKGPVGAVRAGGELIAAKLNTEFHADWIRPNEFDDGLFVRLNSGTTTSCFVVASPRRSESFATPERIKLMSGLVGHLQQAVRTQAKLADLTQSRADLAAALEAIRHGVIVVGPGGEAMHLNSAAENMLRSKDGMHILSGHIGADSADIERQLHRALHVAISGDGSDVRSGRSFTCQRPSGKRPYVIHVLPLHRAQSAEIPRGPTALVLIIDPEHETQPAAALLRQLYDFTNTESEIALRLTRGDDLKQISDALSVSPWTVRTHLKHLFDKTDTHRQAALIRHLLAANP